MTRTENTPFVDRMVTWSLDHPMPLASRYLVAGLLVIFVAILRAAFITSLLPWLPFIPVILGIALILGEGPGVAASIVAAVTAAVSIGQAANPWLLTPPQWGATVFFLAIALSLSRFMGELRASFRRVRSLVAASQEREAFLSGVLASSTDCIKVLDLDGNLSFMSEGGMKVMEVSDFNAVKGCPWPDFWSGDGNAEALTALDAARRGEASHFVGKANTFAGNPRWWDVSVSPILGPDGKPARILSVSRDTTELAKAQEQQRLLNGELGHRLKNLLALVQSIANQTFRRATSIENAGSAFAERLAALGAASDVLTSASWQSATLGDALNAGLISVDGLRDRVSLAGPAVKLDAQVALALTLAVHELTTNACKYGALSNDVGTIAVNWQYETVGDGGDGRLKLIWREAGGPVVSPPTSKGFGSAMIERSLRSYFRGETSLRYDPDGVVFSVDAPLSKASVSVGGSDGAND